MRSGVGDVRWTAKLGRLMYLSGDATPRRDKPDDLLWRHFHWFTSMVFRSLEREIHAVAEENGVNVAPYWLCWYRVRDACCSVSYKLDVDSKTVKFGLECGRAEEIWKDPALDTWNNDIERYAEDLSGATAYMQRRYYELAQECYLEQLTQLRQRLKQEGLAE